MSSKHACDVYDVVDASRPLIYLLEVLEAPQAVSWCGGARYHLVLQDPLNFLSRLDMNLGESQAQSLGNVSPDRTVMRMNIMDDFNQNMGSVF